MDFKAKIDAIYMNASPEQKRRMHFNSLRNFIEYYDQTKKEKIRITELLEQYITLLEKNDYSLTHEESIEAYYLCVDKIGWYYRRYLNFTVYLGYFYIFVLFILPNFLIWITFHSIITSTILAVLIILNSISRCYKYYKHKMYGAGY